MYQQLVHHPFMSKTAVQALSAEALVEAMVRVEVVLAEAEEARSLLPEGTARALEQALSHVDWDIEALAQGVVEGGNMAIPFVKQAKRALPEALREHIHRGATSQDLVDTALMLVLSPRLLRIDTLMRQALTDGDALMRKHRSTPMVGRTLMQQALPVTFGVSVAHWLHGLGQAGAALSEIQRSGLFVQFGGAVGVHSGLEDTGLELMDDMARRLGLSVPLLPWHTQRQPILALVSALDRVAVAGEKIATDVALLTQTELGEVSEPAEDGVGGSSSMPHKRNPVACARIKRAARQIHGHAATLYQAGAQPLERGLGEWHAEWAPLLESVALLEGLMESVAHLMRGLEVHPTRMAENLSLTGGAVMAEPVTRLLGTCMESSEASQLARDAALKAQRTRRDYAEVLFEDARVHSALTREALARATDPSLYLGSSLAQVDRTHDWLTPWLSQ
ncbi:class-II fumarase/aspartase family protein [Larsenimonas salina]|uniref:class-II fumarase/aspartase family protein n=1 Tax=Larsenimonas salina TaxID=1295565 RepID=UPI002072D1FE|nr:adenylosuccinate lyase family protein [Larsenimonas salina]MCM5705258.1 adenylosuccinate lyase family protein [Larsenimonas salina]